MPENVPPSVGRGYEGPRRSPPLLLLLAVLLLALLAVVGFLVWRSLDDDLSGTSVVRDSIRSGPDPRIRLTNAAGQVRVEGVEDLQFLEYEVTRYAMASDPVAAKRRASDVPVSRSDENSTIVLETDGGRGTGADYLLRVPSGGTVEVESGAGDVEVTGLSGDVTVVAEAGDVTVSDAGGDVTVEAPRGDVVVGDVSTDTGQAEVEVGAELVACSAGSWQNIELPQQLDTVEVERELCDLSTVELVDHDEGDVDPPSGRRDRLLRRVHRFRLGAPKLGLQDRRGTVLEDVGHANLVVRERVLPDGVERPGHLGT